MRPVSRLPLSLLLAALALPACSRSADPSAEEETQSQLTLEQRVRRLDDGLAAALTESAKLLLDANEPLPRFSIASDEDFVRRAYLDAIGRLPDAKETLRFLDDPARDKHGRLVDTLLDSPQWSRQWFNHLASLFRLADDVLGTSQAPYLRWMRDAATKDMPWDDLAFALLTASGDLRSDPASGYLLRDHGWLTVTMSETLRLFLSVDMHCTACHDDPFGDRTQMQFYEACACLGATRITRGPDSPADMELWPSTAHLELRARPLAPAESLFISEAPATALVLPRRYLYRDGRPGDLVRPRVPQLDRHAPREELPAQNASAEPSAASIRSCFARWLVRQPQFAETIALRLWISIFTQTMPGGGRIGHEQGAPDLTMAEAMASDGCTSIADTAFLAPIGTGFTSEFIKDRTSVAGGGIIPLLGTLMQETGFDVREFQRILMHSEAYRGAALDPFPPRGPVLLFRPAPTFRRLSPEQLWDSMLAFIGDAPTGWLPGDQMPSTLPEGHPLRVLGRGNREWSGDELRAVSFGLARLMQGSPLIERSVARGGRLHTQCDGAATAREKITLAFLSTLNRRPSASEIAAGEKALAEDPGGGLTAVLSALLNTTEFLFAR